jgi:hypothetical protein
VTAAHSLIRLRGGAIRAQLEARPHLACCMLSRREVRCQEVHGSRPEDVAGLPIDDLAAVDVHLHPRYAIDGRDFARRGDARDPAVTPRQPAPCGDRLPGSRSASAGRRFPSEVNIHERLQQVDPAVLSDSLSNAPAPGPGGDLANYKTVLGLKCLQMSDSITQAERVHGTFRQLGDRLRYRSRGKNSRADGAVSHLQQGVEVA